MRSRGKPAFFEHLTDVAISSLLILPALAYGGVHVWAESIIVIAVSLLCSLWFARVALSGRAPSNTRRIPWGVPALAVAFIMISAMQLIPLSFAMLEHLSPTAYALMTSLLDTASGSHPLSLAPMGTANALAVMIPLMALAYVAARETGSRRRVRRVLLALALAATFQAVYGLSQHFTGSNTIWGSPLPFSRIGASGSFVNTNNFGAFVNMGLFAWVGIMFAALAHARHSSVRLNRAYVLSLIDSPSAPWLLLPAFGITVSALGVIFSFSRTAVLCMAAGFALVALLMTIRKEGHSTMITVALCACIAGASLWYGVSSVGRSFANSVEDLELKRLPLWRNTLEIASDYPLAGTGLGTYRYAINGYRSEDMWVRVTHAHNDYLQVLAETGVPGFLIAGSLFAWILARLMLAIIRETDKERSALMTGILASLVTVAIHGSTDFNMHINANALAASILIGLALGLAGKRTTIKPGLGGRALALLIIVPLIAASIFSVRLLSADRAMPLREDFVRGPLPTSISPDQLPALRSAIQAMPLEPSYQVLLCRRLTEDLHFDEAREACDRALWLAPHAQRSLVALAELDSLSTGFRAAEGTFKLALGVTPYNPVALDAYANLILEHTNSLSPDERPRKIREALDMLDLALKVYPQLTRNIPFQLSRARAYFELEEHAAATEIAGHIPEISPRTLPYKIAVARYTLITGKTRWGVHLYELLLDSKTLGTAGMNQVINAIWDDAERLPASFQVQFLAGQALLKSGNLTHALRFARAAVKLRPMDKRSLKLLAECAEATGDVHEAIGAYETMISRDPDDVEARTEISRLLRKSMGMVR